MMTLHLTSFSSSRNMNKKTHNPYPLSSYPSCDSSLIHAPLPCIARSRTSTNICNNYGKWEDTHCSCSSECCNGSHCCSGKRGSQSFVGTQSSGKRGKEGVVEGWRQQKRFFEKKDGVDNNGGSREGKGYNWRMWGLVRQLKGNRRRGKRVARKEVEEEEEEEAGRGEILKEDKEIMVKEKKETQGNKKNGQSSSSSSSRWWCPKVECAVGLFLALLLITILTKIPPTSCIHSHGHGQSSSSSKCTFFLLSVPLLTCWWYAAAHLRHSFEFSSSSHSHRHHHHGYSHPIPTTHPPPPLLHLHHASLQLCSAALHFLRALLVHLETLFLTDHVDRCCSSHSGFTATSSTLRTCSICTN